MKILQQLRDYYETLETVDEKVAFMAGMLDADTHAARSLAPFSLPERIAYSRARFNYVEFVERPIVIGDADRWQYVRDVLWKDIKRSDLPHELYAYMHEVVDEKYPSAKVLDQAVEYAIRQSRLDAWADFKTDVMLPVEEV